MRRTLTTLSLIFLSVAIVCAVVYAACGDTWQTRQPDTITGDGSTGSCSGPIIQTKYWTAFWTDNSPRDINVTETGQCRANIIFSNTKCYPTMATPSFTEEPNNVGAWREWTYPVKVISGPFSDTCDILLQEGSDHVNRHQCPTQTAGGGDGGVVDSSLNCSYAGQPSVLIDGFASDTMTGVVCLSPILVDVAGDGFNLTDGAGGVSFDLNADGTPEHLSWTAAGSDDSFLVLDRNGDGRISSGRELFGNFTEQSPTDTPNGFLALAEYDRPVNGGNGDGRIDDHDAVFASLRLWQDADHDGVAGPSEMQSLAARGVASLDLSYKQSKRTDAYGNHFLYRAQVRDTNGMRTGRWAWDVFFVLG